MRECDVAVIGGTIKGCLTALELAKAGAKVVLIEPGTFLGSEFTATLRPWIKRAGLESLDEAARYMLFHRQSTEEINSSVTNGEIPLYIGTLKKNVLELLRASGVTVLFMTDIAGVVMDGGAAAGVVTGSKWGLYLLFAKAVIDATGNQKAMRMAGKQPRFHAEKVTAGRVIEYEGAAPEALHIAVPDSLGLSGNRITLHPGKKGAEQKDKNRYFADFGMDVQLNGGSYQDTLEHEMKLRQKTVEVAAYLKLNVPGFADAVLIQSSSRLSLPEYAAVHENQNRDTITEAEGCRNLFTFGAEARLSVNPSCGDVAGIRRCCLKAADTVRQRSLAKPAATPGKEVTVRYGMGADGVLQADLHTAGLKVCEDASLEIPLYPLDIGKLGRIPVIGEFDVIVAGGGTAGAPAAAAVAQRGAKTCLIEPFWGLGGTKTLGKVNAYYLGYRGGYTKEIGLKITEMSGIISGQADENHIESRMTVHLAEVTGYGGTVFFGTTVVGAVMEEARICGVYVINSDGLRIVKCSVAVDSTGDGDLSVFAGAKYQYGAVRDRSVQTFNHNGFVPGSFNDLGVLDITKMRDYMRGLYVAHQQNSHYDFVPMLTVRESRRIAGDYGLTMSDVLHPVCFHDTVSIAMTDCDPHGNNASLLARLGFMPIRDEVSRVYVPYRLCLPLGIDGLLVAAKCLSGTKDAVPYLRMSADLQNLGYAIGVAASIAVRRNTSPRSIPMEELQTELAERGIIPAEAVGAGEEEVGSVDYNEAVDRLAEGQPGALLCVLQGAEEKLLPLLEASLTSLTGVVDVTDEQAETVRTGQAEGTRAKQVKQSAQGKVLVSMALAWFGSKSGAGYLLQELARLYKEENHRPHDDIHPVSGKLNPLAGFIGTPDLYWQINQLIVLLGLTGEREAVPMLSTIASETYSGGAPYQISPPYMYGSIRIDWQRIPHYDRVMSLCLALELLADERAVPALESLLDKPYIGGFVSKTDPYAGGAYMSAYLELVIARALARCGGRKGLMLLADYTEDVQDLIAGHAYSELKDITEVDYGRDTQAWKRWITGAEKLPVKPASLKAYERL